MNLDVKKIIIKFFDKFYWRAHPESALRYLPVVEAIIKAHLADSRILEIGSGSLGIVPYLKRPIDAVDINFSGPQTKLLNKIKGDALDLPFRKNAYDVVISVDVIEHLAKETRNKAIYEMTRVAKKLAILVVPVGELSEEQDRQLDFHWKKIFKTQNKFLEEHVTYGLPTVSEILVYVDKSLRKVRKRAKVTSSPNLNLFVRNILMRTWISKNKYLYYLYMKGFLLFLPILKFANFGNCYRRVFVVEFENPKDENWY